LVPLAVTSTNAALRRMGPLAWRRLHLLAWPATLAAAIHYMMVVKAWPLQPMVYLGIVLALIVLRLARIRRVSRRWTGMDWRSLRTGSRIYHEVSKGWGSRDIFGLCEEKWPSDEIFLLRLLAVLARSCLTETEAPEGAEVRVAGLGAATHWSGWQDGMDGRVGPVRVGLVRLFFVLLLSALWHWWMMKGYAGGLVVSATIVCISAQ